MKALLAVAGRELAERRLLFLGALLLGLLALAAPWLPGPAGSDPAELRGAMAAGLAMIVSSVLALVLGSVIVARDLGERRLGFYFARPLPGWAIWGGKMLAATLLSLGAGALVLLPALLAGGKLDLLDAGREVGFDRDSGISLALLAPLGVLLLLVLAHAGSVMVQSRSSWLLLDGAALTLIVITLWASGRALLWNGAFDCLLWAGVGFLVAALIAGALAGLVQVTRGRTDLHHGHRLLSLTLWGLLGIATLGYAAYSHWVLAVVPEDLVSFNSVVPSPAGSWIGLQGRAAARGRFRPMFLFDVASGRSVRLEGAFQGYWWKQPAFSADGRRAVWLRQLQEGGYDLFRLDLSRPGAAPVQTRIAYPELPQELVLAPDGSRVATVRGNRITVADLETGRLLATIALSEDLTGGDVRLRFPAPGRLRIFQASLLEKKGWRLSVTDLEIASRRSVPVSSLDFAGMVGEFNLTLESRYVAIWQPWIHRFAVGDLETKRVVALSASEFSPGVLLPEGIVVVAKGRGMRSPGRTQITLRILALDGSERLQVDIPGRQIRLGARIAPGLLAVGTSDSTSPLASRRWTSWAVDLGTGGVRRIGPGVPAIEGDQEPGEIGGRLFSLGGGELALLDPATGELRTILRGEPVQSTPR